MPLRNSHKKLLLIAVILQIVWGFVPTASKFVIDEIPVELYIALRWTISGVIFAAYLTFTKSWKWLAPKDFAWISLLGVLGYGVASLGTLYGLKLGGVIHFALVGAAGPIITTVVSVVLLKERPHKRFYLALLASVLGLVILAFGKSQISSVAVVGISVGLILSACSLEALVFIFSKRFKDRVSTVQYLTIAQLAAATFMWILQGVVFHQASDLSLLSLRGVLAALFVSIVACVLCYLVLYWLLNYIEGHRLALFDGIHAVSATAFGYLLLHEHIKPLMFLGGVVLLAGLILGNLPRQNVGE